MELEWNLVELGTDRFQPVPVEFHSKFQCKLLREYGSQ